jgi:hypothetical protein
MTTEQNAEIARGAALVLEIECFGSDGEPVPDLLSMPLYYSVAKSAGGRPILVVEDGKIVRDGPVARVTLTREHTLLLKISGEANVERGWADYFHELYTVDDDLLRTDDSVFMQGRLRVLAAQIAQHPQPE